MVTLLKKFPAIGFGLALTVFSACDSGGMVNNPANADMALLPPPPSMISLGGTVLGVNDQAIPNATVSLGSQQAVTDQDGKFTLNQNSITAPVTLMISAVGYAPLVTILGPGMSLNRFRLQRLNVLAAQSPRFAITVTDPASGAVVSIPKNSLVDVNGNPVTAPVNVAVRYLDPGREVMPGGDTAINVSGQTVYVETLGALYVEARDAANNMLSLKSGMLMDVVLPISSERLPMSPSSVALWHLDTQAGQWKPDVQGGLTAQNMLTKMDAALNSCTATALDPCDQTYCTSVSPSGFVGSAQSLGYLSADIEFNKPSCVRLSIQSPLCLQFEIPFNGGNKIKSACYAAGTSSLYNLGPSTSIKVRTLTGQTCPVTLSTGTNVNSGASWGGTGGPPMTASQCNGVLTVPPQP